MSRSAKTLLGILTFWPMAYMVLFFVFIIATMFLFGPGRNGDEVGVGIAFMAIFALHLLTMLIILGLTVFYIVDVFRNDRVEKDKKALWAIVIFLGNIIGMPIYWYLYIWKTQPALPTMAPGQLGSVNTTAWTTDARAPRVEQEQYVPPAQPPNWRE